ncbi:Protein GVQW3 [Anthophora quadrimaculata]
MIVMMIIMIIIMIIMIIIIIIISTVTHNNVVWGNDCGREEVQDLLRAGRPSIVSTDENIEKIKNMVMDNRRLSVREVAHEVEMSHMSVHNILSEVLGMRRVAARLVSKELNFLQKEHRKAVAEDMIFTSF